jgi:hypothetical protein
MDESRRLMRLHIAGNWTARDFSDLFAAISSLYEIRFLLELAAQDLREIEFLLEEGYFLRPGPRGSRYRRLLRTGFPMMPISSVALFPLTDENALRQLRTFIHEEEALRVQRVEYASPGSIDLAGLGAVMGHIKDLVFKFVDRNDTKKKRHLEDERLLLENERLRIENAREFVALAMDCGYSEVEIRQLVSRVDDVQGPIERLAAQHKLTDVVDVD